MMFSLNSLMTIAFSVLEGQQRGLHEGKYE